MQPPCELAIERLQFARFARGQTRGALESVRGFEAAPHFFDLYSPLSEFIVERAFNHCRGNALVAVDVASCKLQTPTRAPHTTFENEGFIFQASDFQVVLGLGGGQHGRRQIVAIRDELCQLLAQGVRFGAQSDGFGVRRVINVACGGV
jgi:hypothetical protein